mgnify:FL=1
MLANTITARRFRFRDEARADAAEIFGETVAISILGIADQNRNSRVLSPVGMNGNGDMVLTGPFITPFDDMLEEVG